MQSPYPHVRHIGDHYDVVGFISSGTYGRVYKAKTKSKSKVAVKDAKPEFFAIKK